MQLEQIAKVAHETNRAYCETLGDLSQPHWAAAPEWQRSSAIDGVQFHWEALAQGKKPSPSASHENWLKEKERDGWKYGPVKNPDTKEHPCFLPYEQLPESQKIKDYLFSSVVEAFYKAVCG